MGTKTIITNAEANYVMEVTTDDVLHIKVDLKKALGVSKTGKSQVIASTHGNIVLPSGERIGLNVFQPV